MNLVLLPIESPAVCDELDASPVAELTGDSIEECGVPALYENLDAQPGEARFFCSDHVPETARVS